MSTKQAYTLYNIHSLIQNENSNRGLTSPIHYDAGKEIASKLTWPKFVARSPFARLTTFAGTIMVSRHVRILIAIPIESEIRIGCPDRFLILWATYNSIACWKGIETIAVIGSTHKSCQITNTTKRADMFTMINYCTLMFWHNWRIPQWSNQRCLSRMHSIQENVDFDM